MDLRHNHASDVYVLRACYHEDGTDLVAVGGAHSVEVLQTTPNSCKVIANFHIGTRTTALAWSSRVSSSATAEEWSLELTAAGADLNLYLLTKSYEQEEEVFRFGGGLSGHNGRINDMTFCGGQSEDSYRYLATVSDDKMLMVWDLIPSEDFSPTPDSDASEESYASASRPQPTACVVPFPHPLTTVSAHPTTSKEFLVSDTGGSVFLTDWRTDPLENMQGRWRRSSVIELVVPSALANSIAGRNTCWTGSAAWRRDAVDIVGAVYGSKFALWDLANLGGGKPNITGATFPEGGEQFRWCPTFPEFFAISASPPTKGAVINLYNMGYIQAQPTVYKIASRPLYVRTFDFMGTRGIPRIAAGVGHEVVFFYIGDDA